MNEILAKEIHNNSKVFTMNTGQDDIPPTKRGKMMNGPGFKVWIPFGNCISDS